MSGGLVGRTLFERMRVIALQAQEHDQLVENVIAQAATITALQAEVAALREVARDAISEIENGEQYNAADTLRIALERPKP